MPADIDDLEGEKSEEKPAKESKKRLDEKKTDKENGKPAMGLQGFKDKKGLWALLIAIIIPVNLLLLYTYMYGFCFATVLIAFAMFGIPYLFGVRKAKPFLVFGTVIMILTAVLFGALLTQCLYTKTGPYALGPLHDKDNLLRDGTVSPYTGSSDTRFSFTVSYKGNASDVKVDLLVYSNGEHPSFKYDNGSSEWVLRRSMTPMGRGSFITNITSMEADLYRYAYQANVTTGTKWALYNTTTAGYGPITVQFSTVMMDNILWFSIVIFIIVGLLYYVLIGMFWWTQRAKREKEKYLDRVDEDDKEERKEGAKGGKKKSEFTCSSCGADVSADDSKCPKCGESFDGDDAGEKGKDMKAGEKGSKGKDDKGKDDKSGKKNW